MRKSEFLMLEALKSAPHLNDKLSEIASCASCASIQWSQPCACWMAALTITGKPTGFYSRIYTREWPFIRELKYEVVMLPRWLVSTPIRTYGWEGSLKMQTQHVCISDDCRNGSIGTTDVAIAPTESSPNNRERRAGLTWFGLLHEGFWAKKWGRRCCFSWFSFDFLLWLSGDVLWILVPLHLYQKHEICSS